MDVKDYYKNRMEKIIEKNGMGRQLTAMEIYILCLTGTVLNNNELKSILFGSQTAGLGIQRGDMVLMNDKYWVPSKLKGVIYTVTSEPYDLNGVQCVNLDKYTGAYAIDGLMTISWDN